MQALVQQINQAYEEARDALAADSASQAAQ
jgi:hypothetical protein